MDKSILKPDSECTWEQWMAEVIKDFFHYQGIEDTEIFIEVGYEDIHGDIEWEPASEKTFLQWGEPDKQKISITTKTQLPMGLLEDLKNRITQAAWPYLHKDWYNVGKGFTTPWWETPDIICNHDYEIHGNEDRTPYFYEIINRVCYCS